MDCGGGGGGDCGVFNGEGQGVFVSIAHASHKLQHH